MDKFTEDFEKFWTLINNRINFAFSRYADGEVMLMQGKAVGNNTQAFTVDKWSSPEVLTRAGRDLLKTINHTEPNYYYAISGKNDNVSDYTYLKNIITQNESNLTFVNLWINANYTKMQDNLKKLDRSVVLICNENAKTSNFPFMVTDITTFPSDCINFWAKFAEAYINYLVDKYKDMTNQLFFISCGPISEIIIHYLYNSNPNNTYIDVGSSIDEYVHGYKTRPYMDPNSQYSKLISTF